MVFNDKDKGNKGFCPYISNQFLAKRYILNRRVFKETRQVGLVTGDTLTKET